jgi:hypothetical protein
MGGAALESDRSSRLPGHAGDDPQGLSEALEHGSLLDVDFEESAGKLCEPPAPHRSGLLGPEGNNGERRFTQAVSGFDRRNDTERAVKAAAVRNGVEMGAAPDPGVPAMPEEIPRLVATDLEPGVAHPPVGELVGCVLFGGVAEARAASDRVQLFEPG